MSLAGRLAYKLCALRPAGSVHVYDLGRLSAPDGWRLLSSRPVAVSAAVGAAAAHGLGRV